MSKKSLIILMLVIVVLAAVAKKAKSERGSEWHGLTETEARSRLDAKLPGKIPAEKRSAISDKLVSKMRDRGVIVEDPAVPDDASDLAEDAEQLTNG